MTDPTQLADHQNSADSPAAASAPAATSAPGAQQPAPPPLSLVPTSTPQEAAPERHAKPDKFQVLSQGIASLHETVDALSKKLTPTDLAKRTADIITANLAAQGASAAQDGPLPSAGGQPKVMEDLQRAVQSVDESLRALVEDRRAQPPRPPGLPWMRLASVGAVIAAVAFTAGAGAGLYFAPTPKAPADKSGGWANKIYQDLGSTIIGCYQQSNAKNGDPVPCTITVTYPRAKQ